MIKKELKIVYLSNITSKKLHLFHTLTIAKQEKPAAEVDKKPFDLLHDRVKNIVFVHPELSTNDKLNLCNLFYEYTYTWEAPASL